MDYSIRRMKRSEAKEIIEIDKRNFKAPITEGILLSELDREISYYVSLYEGEKLIGYAGMWEVMGEAHITHICVDIPYRGRGYGNILLEHLIRRCIKRHFFAMLLEVRVSNEVAISLYKKYNFTNIGVRKNYYTDSCEDALVMWRDVFEGETI